MASGKPLGKRKAPEEDPLVEEGEELEEEKGLTSAKLLPSCDVPFPRIATLPIPVLTKSSGRRDPVAAFKAQQKFKAWTFLNNADVFKSDVSLEELAADVVDCNGKIIFAYFANRLLESPRITTLNSESTEEQCCAFFLAKAKPINMQYAGRTRKDMLKAENYTYDGLPGDILTSHLSI
ncbi:hypothetical protein C8R47DRAFT_1226735 [Mycena vitilis]|nr:hypothetical protein C8R47DRAFT_1226735 [Mycena vitilis]